MLRQGKKDRPLFRFLVDPLALTKSLRVVRQVVVYQPSSARIRRSSRLCQLGEQLLTHLSEDSFRDSAVLSDRCYCTRVSGSGASAQLVRRRLHKEENRRGGPRVRPNLQLRFAARKSREISECAWPHSDCSASEARDSDRDVSFDHSPIGTASKGLWFLKNADIWSDGTPVMDSRSSGTRSRRTC